MGEVFLATDTLLDRPVALKFIAMQAEGEEARRRFMNEARAIARLQHPNVVAIHRVGQVAGHPYLVSEFVRGQSLDRVDLPMPWARAQRIGLGVARGLAAAHRRGVVHRDVKPANILLGDDDEPKLGDFGIAKLVDAHPEAGGAATSPGLDGLDASRASALDVTVLPRATSLLAHHAGARSGTLSDELQGQLTLPGERMGTPLYMAPEVWDGEEATFRSDVYSFGALLFTLCVGEPPHRAATLAELRERVLTRPARPLADVVPGVDPRFAAVVDRCLSRAAEARFASGAELSAALQELGAERPGAALPSGNPYRSLHSFEAEHSALFFGRDAEIRAIAERLRSETTVAITGDSGVGKSSLCRAGILPRVPAWLDGERAFSTLTLVPGPRPMTALAAALAPLLELDEATLVTQLADDPAFAARSLRRALGSTRGLLLFVDQLEELITLASPHESELFAAVLGWIGAPSRALRLLVTVRGDFLGRLAALGPLGDVISSALYILRPLTADRVRDAIVEPARALGVTLESEAMVDALVSSTVGAEGGLPLLQFALAELWEARDVERGVIPAAALEVLGGVAGALGRHADDVLARMVPDVARAARRILLRLVTASGTRARRTESELAGGSPRGTDALEALVRGRLVVARSGTDGSTYELAHEALLNGWSRLAGWLAAGADTRAARQRLAAAVAEWNRLERAREALWSARQLEELTQVDAEELTDDERSFLRASRARGRRARLLRVLGWLSLPTAVVLAYGGVTLEARRALGARVDAHVAEAETALVEARAARAEATSLRGQAFALFDARRREEAEAAWRRALAANAGVESSYGRASQSLEAALMLDPAGNTLRERFAELLYERILVAEAQRDAVGERELRRRLSVYDDDGAQAARLDAPAELALETLPAGAEVLLRPLGSQGAEEAERSLGSAPLAALRLTPGSYALRFEAPGRAPVREVLTLTRGERLALRVTLPRASDVPEGYVHVPPGRFLFGSAADESLRASFYNTAPLHEVHTEGYLIALRETTFADWLVYLRALPFHERKARFPSVDTGGFKGALGFREVTPGRFELAFQPAGQRLSALDGEPIRYPARGARATQDWRLFPVFGVNVADVQGYLDWLSSSGRLPGARLCTEHEWERATRGSDGRPYPHGDQLAPEDADFDATYGQDPLAMGPDEVGSHPRSRSPFGLEDTAGNVWEWTRSSLESGGHAARGGSYYFDANSSRSDNRQVSEPTLRDASVGFRVCADSPTRADDSRGAQ